MGNYSYFIFSDSKGEILVDKRLLDYTNYVEDVKMGYNSISIIGLMINEWKIYGYSDDFIIEFIDNMVYNENNERQIYFNEDELNSRLFEYSEYSDEEGENILDENMNQIDANNYKKKDYVDYLWFKFERDGIFAIEFQYCEHCKKVKFVRYLYFDGENFECIKKFMNKDLNRPYFKETIVYEKIHNCEIFSRLNNDDSSYLSLIPKYIFFPYLVNLSYTINEFGILNDVKVYDFELTIYSKKVFYSHIYFSYIKGVLYIGYRNSFTNFHLNNNNILIFENRITELEINKNGSYCLSPLKNISEIEKGFPNYFRRNKEEILSIIMNFTNEV